MSYTALESHFRRLGHLQHTAAILQWDEAVMMPPSAGPARAEAMATLDVVMHEMLTDPRLTEWLLSAEAQRSAGELDPWQSANVREMRRLVRRATAVPSALVEAASRAHMRCEQAWRVQRAQNDFAAFAPLLQEVVDRKREVAAALGEALGLTPYDALMDEYEPGARAEDIDRLFAQLRSFLPALTQEVLEFQRSKVVHQPRGPFPIAAQQQLCKTLMRALGFDERHGRQDVSHHPFCGGVPTDVRITTRFDEANFAGSMMGVLHETGHAKYEQGLPRSWLGQPVGSSRGMSIHESQSLLHEMQVCRGRDFLEFAAPLIAQAFPEAAAAQPEAFSATNLFRLNTRVVPGKIRIDADEVTYPSHIVLRYELERALVNGTMGVRDLPEAWDGGMRSALGISTGDDHRNGCMQDVHWPSGAFGYFPTYTLGALTAAQLFATAVDAEPSIPAELARGSFEHLDRFLHSHVWSRASLHTTDELVRLGTGRPLDARLFEAHLRRRYLT